MYSSSGAASTVIFVYGLDGQLLGEYDGSGTALREYVWLGSKPVAVFTPDVANAANPPSVYFIQADHLDTPRVISDRNDKRRWRWLAEPFGTTAAETNPDGLGVFTQNLRFPGQYADVESGLFYNYFRDYDASIGRYAESDPIGLMGGINTYGYVRGNPLSHTDWYGLGDFNEAETRLFLDMERSDAQAPKPISHFNMYNNHKGKGHFDFGVTQPNDTFVCRLQEDSRRLRIWKLYCWLRGSVF